MAYFYTEGDRQAIIFLLKSVNYDNINTVSKGSQVTNFSRKVLQELVNLFISSLFYGSFLYWYGILFIFFYYLKLLIYLL